MQNSHLHVYRNSDNYIHKTLLCLLFDRDDKNFDFVRRNMLVTAKFSLRPRSDRFLPEIVNLQKPQDEAIKKWYYQDKLAETLTTARPPPIGDSKKPKWNRMIQANVLGCRGKKRGEPWVDDEC